MHLIVSQQLRVLMASERDVKQSEQENKFRQRSVCVMVVPTMLWWLWFIPLAFQGFLNLNSLDLFGALLTHSLCL